MGSPATPEPDGRRPSATTQESERHRDLLAEVAVKERRKLRARRTRRHGIWFGLGTFGVIGWSVAIPTVIGILAGLWLDAAYPGRLSWTVALLFAGVALGCLNAWYWVSREGEMIQRERQNGNNRG